MAEKRKIAVRPWLRALHRDLGYLAVGFTVLYALSGLAVNHIADWDPNFHEVTVVHEVGPLPRDDEDEAAKAALQKLGVVEKPRSVDKVGDDAVDVVFDKRTFHVTPSTGHVVEEVEKPRFLLRVANWLHLNRGKKAWTYLADAYAAGLLFLAVSGLFMIPGRKGLVGRGAVLVGIGIAIPVAYVQLSGGPEAARAAPSKPARR